MLIPLNNCVIVKAPERTKQTKGGVFVPDSVDEDRPEKGEVVAASETVSQVKVGDTVVFKKFAPDEFKDGEETYLILNVEDVLAKIA